MSTFLLVMAKLNALRRFSQRCLHLHPGKKQGAGVDISVSLSVEVTTTTSGTAARSGTGSMAGIVIASCSSSMISGSMISGSGAVSAGMYSLKIIGLEVPGGARIDVLVDASRGLSR